MLQDKKFLPFFNRMRFTCKDNLDTGTDPKEPFMLKTVELNDRCHSILLCFETSTPAIVHQERISDYAVQDL
jgi:hypothetical protein